MPATAGVTGGVTDVFDLARHQSAPCAEDFYLGDWLVQPGLNRASSGGKSIHLRPQLMDVLVCLARRPGSTVPRHDLLDQVWPGQFVAETALARCVAELRQALGDRAHQPVVIETIPKRGYRLIAPVAATAGRPRPETRFRVYSFPPQAEGSGGRLLAPVAPSPAVVDEGGSIDERAAATAAPDAAARIPRALGRWFALLGWAGVFVLRPAVEWVSRGTL